MTSGSKMDKAKIAVVGAGLMGIGIATQYIVGGHLVIVYDVDENRLRDAATMASKNLDEMVSADAISYSQSHEALDRLFTTNSLSDLACVSVVIEAVPEVLSLKQSVYRSLESVIPPTAILASNTSGFDPESLCAELIHPERFLIAHFWNPPYLLPLAEIVPSHKTRQTYVDAIEEQLEGIGLATIVLKKSIPGFIGNRVQFAILREALHLLRQGVASPEEIDTVIQLTLGRRYRFAGPLASADLGGLNTIMEVAKHLMPELAKDESAIDLLSEHVEHNEIGVRSGRGFYEWTPERLEQLKTSRQRLLRSPWQIK
jgi:3-hydroxybutyryl-CoA dehydrogenase